MLTLLRFFVLFAGLFALASLPPILIARRRGRLEATRRNFMIGAAAVGLFCALVAGGQQRLVNNCTVAGNTQCNDYGGTGMLWIAGIGFVATSLGRSYLMLRE